MDSRTHSTDAFIASNFQASSLILSVNDGAHLQTHSVDYQLPAVKLGIARYGRTAIDRPSTNSSIALTSDNMRLQIRIVVHASKLLHCMSENQRLLLTGQVAAVPIAIHQQVLVIRLSCANVQMVL